MGLNFSSPLFGGLKFVHDFNVRIPIGLQIRLPNLFPEIVDIGEFGKQMLVVGNILVELPYGRVALNEFFEIGELLS